MKEASIKKQASSTIKSFTDLKTWREGHKLVLEIYNLTNSFPKEEQFGLANQMRSAAVSITSNIAEGFSRNSYKEKKQFYTMSLGLLTELQNQLLIARDIFYITKVEFTNIAAQSVLVNKLINGLIKSSKYLIPNT